MAETLSELASHADFEDDFYVVSVRAPYITQSVLLAYDEGANAGNAKRLSKILSNVISKGFVKLDVRNAFNEFNRAAMLQAVDVHIPSFSRYIRSMYGSASKLFCGEHIIYSRMGCHQGDVLGTPLFALLQSEAWLRAKRST